MRNVFGTSTCHGQNTPGPSLIGRLHTWYDPHMSTTVPVPGTNVFPIRPDVVVPAVAAPTPPPEDVMTLVTQLNRRLMAGDVHGVAIITTDADDVLSVCCSAAGDRAKILCGLRLLEHDILSRLTATFIPYETPTK
jgi:hypothetical protein